jgi:hypothetical protein
MKMLFKIKMFLIVVVLFPVLTANAACPPGQHFDSAMGMCMPDPTCASGQHYDPDMNMCMPDVTPSPTPTCPQGQSWDSSMNMCMPIPAPTTFRGISQNIFATSCISCHKVNSPTDPAEAGLDFSSFQLMMNCNHDTGNTKHAPFIIAGDPEHSKLYIALKSGNMPATEAGPPGPKLADALIQNVYDWIKAGAPNN